MYKRHWAITGDVLFYGVVTAVVMVTTVFSAFEGVFGSALMGPDGGPYLSDGEYVTGAAFCGALSSLGCSVPFLVVFLFLGLGSDRHLRIIWIAGMLSACFFAMMMMLLTLFTSGDSDLILSLSFAAAVPPGLLGLRVIRQTIRSERAWAEVIRNPAADEIPWWML